MLKGDSSTEHKWTFLVDRVIRRKGWGRAKGSAMAYKVNSLPVVPASHMDPGSRSGCSTSEPAPS